MGIEKDLGLIEKNKGLTVEVDQPLLFETICACTIYLNLEEKEKKSLAKQFMATSEDNTATPNIQNMHIIAPDWYAVNFLLSLLPPSFIKYTTHVVMVNWNWVTESVRLGQMLDTMPFILRPRDGYVSLILPLPPCVKVGIFQKYNTCAFFCTRGMSQTRATKLREKLKLRGGEVHLEISDATTHIIASNWFHVTHCIDNREQYLEEKSICSYDWLIKSFKCGVVMNESPYELSPKLLLEKWRQEEEKRKRKECEKLDLILHKIAMRRIKEMHDSSNEESPL